MRKSIGQLATSLVVAATAAAADTADHSAVEKAAHQAHEAYVEAINSNDVDTMMPTVTDDIVYIAPNSPAVIGRAAVRAWLQDYFSTFRSHWEKTSVEFVVTGEWAFEHYTYKSLDRPKAGGADVKDSGNGINIYHHDTDGTWRVARDAWATDQPPTK